MSSIGGGGASTSGAVSPAANLAASVQQPRAACVEAAVACEEAHRNSNASQDHEHPERCLDGRVVFQELCEVVPATGAVTIIGLT